MTSTKMLNQGQKYQGQKCRYRDKCAEKFFFASVTTILNELVGCKDHGN